MIETTLDILRARREERVAIAGVISALFCDDPMKAVTQLEGAAEAARECSANATLVKHKRMFKMVASVADDIAPLVRQVAEQRVKEDTNA